MIGMYAQFNVGQWSLDGCILRDGCRIPHRKLQVPQARSQRGILYASSTSHGGTGWDRQWKSPAPCDST